MANIRFEWDERKGSLNRRKHRVSFDEAITAFYDENALLINDPDHSDEEERFVLMGFSQLLRILVVCHCYRENEQIIRIISARKATKAERKQYIQR